MKTDGTTEVLPLSKKQKYASNIVMGVLLMAAGVILILAGRDIIKAPVSMIAAPTVLFAFGTAILFSAIIAKNSISMWIAGVILTCGLVSLLDITTPAGYGNLYPLYIASPGIGCLFAMCFSAALFPQIKAIILFGGLAAVFSLQSSGACGWGVTAGVLAGFVGACVVAYAVSSYLKKEKKDA